MTPRRLTTLVCAAAATLLLCCCAPRIVYDKFVKSRNVTDGVYSFELPFEDTLSTYDLSFYTRIDRPDSKPFTKSVRLDVSWTSPSGEKASETVYMDAANEVEIYRRGVRPDEQGIWKIDVRVPDAPEGFRGLGIKSEDNGTR